MILKIWFDVLLAKYNSSFYPSSEICTILTLLLLFQIQIWIYGNSFESFLVSVVNPNKQALERWAVENSVTGDFNSICENPRAKEYILGELTKVAKEKKVATYFLSVVCVLLSPYWLKNKFDLQWLSSL